MSHSYANAYMHVVYSTKNREDLIPADFERRLYSCVAVIARDEKIPLLAAGGTANHCHLLFVLPATISLASAIGVFKSNSSRFSCEQGVAFEWQKGYGAFSVSASNLGAVTAYIRNQAEHHKKMTFEQEFVAMLNKAKVAYDAKFVFG